MFDAFVSLGPNCGIAASMSKYGFRSFSGPFDWLITEDFRWVLHFMETDFSDFIRRDQLVPYSVRVKEFRDETSGFIFLHEEADYRFRYESIKEKYDRRIQKFLRASCKKTCFLRYVDRQEELDYIKNNAEYVRHIIGRHNRQNEILFLVNKGIHVPEDMPFRTFQIWEKQSGKTWLLLRAWFDGMAEFLEYCIQNYPSDKLMKNLIFDWEAKEREYQRMEGRYRTVAAMSLYDFSQIALPPEIMIYGAGRMGQILYEKIKPYTRIKCFVDGSKYNTKFGEIPIYSIDDLDHGENTLMIVSTTYDFESIQEDVQKRCKDMRVVSLDQLLEGKG